VEERELDLCGQSVPGGGAGARQLKTLLSSEVEAQRSS